jgi:hypothetical protein
MESADLLRAVFERFDAHEGLEGLHTEDLLIIGDPPAGFVQPRGRESSAERIEQLHARGLSFHLREVEDVGPGRALFSAVWRHAANDRSGSAGLYWGAVVLRDGKIAQLTYCASRREAERALGLRP